MRELCADRGRGRRAGIACGLALLLLAGVAQARSGAFPAEKFDRRVHKAYPDGGPGCIAVVMKDGEVIHSTAAGLADIASNTPFTLDTRVDLASCSKAFTAMAALVLVERGKLSLDTDVREHLPELDRKRYREPIPLDRLLGMTAGLPGYEDLFDELGTVTNARVAAALGKLKPKFKVGKKYEYSNSAYALAALAVTRASGEPFPKFVKEAILDPAGMKDTFVMDRPGMNIPRRATGYKRVDGEVKPSINDTSCMGDGQVVTSARDMVLWDKALRARAVTTPELMERAFKSGKLVSGEKTEYGFGWGAYKQGGQRWIEHTGGWDGTATFIRIYLDDGPSIVILSNDEDSEPNELADELDPLINR